jgi:dihydroorotate dehydrogenase
MSLLDCLFVLLGEDAYKKIRAGASLVELYTAFAYEGPAAIPAIKQQLVDCLQRDGFNSVAEAVGADHQAAGSRLKRKRSWSIS